MKQGPLIIAAMLLVGVALAGFAVWWHYQQGRRALAYWGTQRATLIRHAPHVLAMRLGQPAAGNPQSGEPPATIVVDGRPLAVLDSLSIEKLPGLVHTRHALIEDASYDWQHKPPQCQWQYALKFDDGSRSALVLIDLSNRAVRPLDRPQPLLLTEPAWLRLRFYTEQVLLHAAGGEADPPASLPSSDAAHLSGPPRNTTGTNPMTAPAMNPAP